MAASWAHDVEPWWMQMRFGPGLSRPAFSRRKKFTGDLDDLYSNLHLPGATALRRHRDRKITLLLTAVEDINKWRISRGDGGTTDFPGPGQFAIIRVQIFRQDRDPLDPQAFGQTAIQFPDPIRNLACTAGIETSSCWFLEPRPRWLHQLLTFAVSISISKATKSRFRPRAIAPNLRTGLHSSLDLAWRERDAAAQCAEIFDPAENP